MSVAAADDDDDEDEDEEDEEDEDEDEEEEDDEEDEEDGMRRTSNTFCGHRFWSRCASLPRIGCVIVTVFSGVAPMKRLGA